MKMLIRLELHSMFNQILHINTFKHYRDIGMQNGG